MSQILSGQRNDILGVYLRKCLTAKSVCNEIRRFLNIFKFRTSFRSIGRTNLLFYSQRLFCFNAPSSAPLWLGTCLRTGKSQVINSCSISSINFSVSRYCAFSNCFLSTFFVIRSFVHFLPSVLLFSLFVSCRFHFTLLVTIFFLRFVLQFSLSSSLLEYPKDTSPSLELHFFSPFVARLFLLT